VDSRTRKNHIQQRINDWKKQTPSLVKTYLDWKDLGAPSSNVPGTEETGWMIEVMSFTCTFHICRPGILF
jgi:hypothetical protein